MSSKIDGVPRELIEKAMQACFEAGHGITHDGLRALLDALAAPSKFVGAAQYWSENEQSLRDVCRFEGLKGLVYQVVRDCSKPAAPPELAELQATIVRLTAENERLKESHQQICANYNEVSHASEKRGNQIDELKSEIERLKAGQGEQFGWIVKRIKPSGVEKLDRALHSFATPDYLGPAFECIPVFASHPAPVSVRITLQQVLRAYDYAESHPHRYLHGSTNWCAAVAHELNACLDKVKELNQ